ncbi:hypothetical protein M758_6G170500 [Ceratodon purpureus]|nr:hypothetical protein M758_6G170500 [Ceratodon purpureus]
MADYLDLQSVEVKVLRARNLMDVKRWSLSEKMNPFVQVWICSKESKKYTKILYNGGRNPIWNSDILQLFCTHTDLFRQSVYLNIDVFHRGSKDDKLLGQVKIPLTFQYKEKKVPIVVKWPLSLPNGKEQGTIELSIKIKNVLQEVISHESTTMKASKPRVYPVVEHHVPFSGHFKIYGDNFKNIYSRSDSVP